MEAWIAAIREEEALAMVNQSVADVDKWEHADDREEEARAKVKTAKKAYEAALREKFFNFWARGPVLKFPRFQISPTRHIIERLISGRARRQSRALALCSQSGILKIRQAKGGRAY